MYANARERSTVGYDLQIFLDQEYQVQRALSRLGMDQDSPPSQLPGVNEIQGPLERITNFSLPYAIEVMGMPNTFKSTAINTYLKRSWIKGNRPWFSNVAEGTQILDEQDISFKQDNPFLYSMMVGLGSYLASYQSLVHINEFKILLQDRGNFDRGVFRRALTTLGYVNPGIMRDEALFEYGLESPILPVGGVVLCLQTLDTSRQRGCKMSMEQLQVLYSQYLRFYDEMRREQRLVPSFIALDLETDVEQAQTNIVNAIDSIVYRPLAMALSFPANISSGLI